MHKKSAGKAGDYGVQTIVTGATGCRSVGRAVKCLPARRGKFSQYRQKLWIPNAASFLRHDIVFPE